MLPEIGGAGQQALARASVALVGLGGLGCAILPYLDAAGIGELILIDGDHIALSDLHRQTLYRTEDVGRGKVEIAARQVRGAKVTAVAGRLGCMAEAEQALAGADLMIDATDNEAARELLNLAAGRLATPLVSGAVIRFEGWISVFNHGQDRDAPCWRCLFPEAGSAGDRCATLGILGPAAGVIGSLMATEAIKLLTGAGEPLIGRVLQADMLFGEITTVRLEKSRNCVVCGSSVAV